MSTQNEAVLYSVEGAIARITLNRPDKRNALNDELIAQIGEYLAEEATRAAP